MPLEKIVYNAKDISAILDVSVPVAYSLLAREDFPTIKIGERRIVVPIDAFNKWLERQSGNKN